MYRDVCRIKGGRQGLVITIAAGAELAEVLKQLQDKLSAAEGFFAGAKVKLAFEDGRFSKEQVDAVAEVIAAHGMALDREQPVARFAPPAPSVADMYKDAEEATGEQTLLVRRTLRSGQRVHYDGNIVVMGDVNPGAEVACTGDIVVLGSLRGVAHAGIADRVDAMVFAFRLEPTQLRIAHYIARSPDEKLPQPLGPEVARVVDNMIQISAYTHWGS